jgi:hypothetical protein
VVLAAKNATCLADRLVQGKVHAAMRALRHGLLGRLRLRWRRLGPLRCAQQHSRSPPAPPRRAGTWSLPQRSLGGQAEHLDQQASVKLRISRYIQKPAPSPSARSPTYPCTRVREDSTARLERQLNQPRSMVSALRIQWLEEWPPGALSRRVASADFSRSGAEHRSRIVATDRDAATPDIIRP